MQIKSIDGPIANAGPLQHLFGHIYCSHAIGSFSARVPEDEQNRADTTLLVLRSEAISQQHFASQSRLMAIRFEASSEASVDEESQRRPWYTSQMQT